MTELLEANERSQAEQGMPDSKKQDEKMQIGVDSFAAQFADKGESVNASANSFIGPANTVRHSPAKAFIHARCKIRFRSGWVWAGHLNHSPAPGRWDYR